MACERKNTPAFQHKPGEASKDASPPHLIVLKIMAQPAARPLLSLVQPACMIAQERISRHPQSRMSESLADTLARRNVPRQSFHVFLKMVQKCTMEDGETKLSTEQITAT